MKILVHFFYGQEWQRRDTVELERIRRKKRIPSDVVFFTVPEGSGEAFGCKFSIIDLDRFLKKGGRTWLASAEAADRVTKGWTEEEAEYWIKEIRNSEEIPGVKVHYEDDYDACRTSSWYKPYLPEVMLYAESKSEAERYLERYLRKRFEFDRIYDL